MLFKKTISLIVVCLLFTHTQVNAAVLTALDNKNGLVFFDSNSPDVSTSIPITGLPENFQVRAIDYRAIDGKLYGLARSSVFSSPQTPETASFVTIDTNTGVATHISYIAPNNIAQTGIAWDPVNDNFVIGATASPVYRITPNGEITKVSNGISWSPLPSSPFPNNFAGYEGLAYSGFNASFEPITTIPTLYGVNNSGFLVYVDSNYQANVVGDLGVTFGNPGGFAIDLFTNNAFAALGNTGDTQHLYLIDFMNTAIATDLGALNTTNPIMALAIAPVKLLNPISAVPEPSNAATLLLGLALLASLLRHKKQFKW